MAAVHPGWRASNDDEVLTAELAEPSSATDSDRAATTLRILRSLDAALSATLDPNLRMRKVARFICDTAPEQLAQVLEHSARDSVAGGWRQTWLALLHWMLHARPRPRFPVGHWPVPSDDLAPDGTHIAEIIEAAVALQLPFTSIVLRDAFARLAGNEAQLLQLHPSVEKWSLGLRRERARATATTHQNWLLLDSTPAVVQILAENPKTLEPHAVQIASMRPQHPWALQALLLQPRWLGNDKVCEAAARNSSTPTWLVLALAPLLPRKIQMALVHLHWIDRDARAILGQWHGVAMLRLSAHDPGQAFVVDEDVDLEKFIQDFAPDHC
ncbi:MAG: hypothetical protein EXR77_03840 [Myxococcales bacterium]|nr:hypothetical protein [Myxococcales bacterium]